MTWGIFSTSLYAAMLIYQDPIATYFALGGIYTLLPIMTAFVFSWVHGPFTDHFWTALGIEASNKKKSAWDE